MLCVLSNRVMDIFKNEFQIPPCTAMLIMSTICLITGFRDTNLLAYEDVLFTFEFLFALSLEII